MRQAIFWGGLVVFSSLTLAPGCSERFRGGTLPSPSDGGQSGESTVGVAGADDDEGGSRPIGGRAGDGGDAPERGESGRAPLGGEAGAGAEICSPDLDLDTDPRNCGTCAHDCLGGDCVAGSCQPIEIARDQGRVFTIAVDSEFIYWAGDGSVVAKKRLDNTGGIIELVPASAKEYVYDWVLVGKTLYWGNDWNDNGVRGCALPDCSAGPQTLVTAATPIRGLRYDSHLNALYFTQTGAVWRKVLPSGASSELTLANNQAAALASDGSFVYFNDYKYDAQSSSGTSTIRKVNASMGGEATLIARKGLSSVNDMSVWDAHLYVLDGHDNSAGRIVRIALPNGLGEEELPLFATTDPGAIKMAVDNSGVYWTQGFSGAGTIRTCAIAGCNGQPVLLANSIEPWGITTDEKAIYWTTQQGQVMKLAK